MNSTTIEDRVNEDFSRQENGGWEGWKAHFRRNNKFLRVTDEMLCRMESGQSS